MLTLFVTPVFYLDMDTLQKKLRSTFGGVEVEPARKAPTPSEASAGTGAPGNSSPPPRVAQRSSLHYLQMKSIHYPMNHDRIRNGKVEDRTS